MSKTFLYCLFSDKNMFGALFHLFFVCMSVFNYRTIGAPTFDNLQDLEEQDFEQLGGDKCP
jgi:hypothetical protein